MNLEDTVKEYIAAATLEVPVDSFGKTRFPNVESLRERALDPSAYTFPRKTAPKLFVAAVGPAIHYTMGGVSINSAAEVLAKSEEQSFAIGSGSGSLTYNYDPFSAPLLRTIPNLFCAGEAAGGLHGKNRLAGNSLLECVVFGRIAADRALNVQLRGLGLEESTWTSLSLRESARICNDHFLFRFNLQVSRHRIYFCLIRNFIHFSPACRSANYSSLRPP